MELSSAVFQNVLQPEDPYGIYESDFVGQIRRELREEGFHRVAASRLSANIRKGGREKLVRSHHESIGALFHRFQPSLLKTSSRGEGPVFFNAVSAKLDRHVQVRIPAQKLIHQPERAVTGIVPSCMGPDDPNFGVVG